ncbi:MAG TPA: GAF domain-containing SpoIIE family protein phosphatase [Candidatus Polarisedimenticolaceae bacterium]
MSREGEVLERVLAVNRSLARSLDLTTLLSQVVDTALELLDAERGSVFLHEPASGTLVSRVATGTGELRIPADRGIVGECVATREIVLVADAYADPRFNRQVDLATGYRTRSMLTMPLIGHDDTLVGVLQVLNKRGGSFGDADLPIATALAATCAIAIQRMRLLEEIVEKRRMERELEVARDIQTRVFPKSMPEIPGYDVAGWSRPADQTGGDIFDVIAAPGSVLLLLGDATGHGVGPAISVTQVRAMLRIAARLGAGLDHTFRNINDQLSDDLSDNRFVTAFLGVLDPASHRVVYHAGGQGPLLHWRAAERTIDWLTSSTLPLGMLPFRKTPESRWIDMAPGDVLALVSDGIFECENAAGEAFGNERAGAIVSAGTGAAETVARMVAEADAFRGSAPQQDDMTVLVLRRRAAGRD